MIVFIRDQGVMATLYGFLHYFWCATCTLTPVYALCFLHVGLTDIMCHVHITYVSFPCLLCGVAWHNWFGL